MKMNGTLLSVYETLFAHYGNLNWWPAKTPYEVIVGAILTQNTNWSNVEKAIANFGDDLSPEFVANAGFDELACIIKPAGFFNQKTGYLKAVTTWFAVYSYDVSTVQSFSQDVLRNELLSVKGIGQETADSILLYAFGFPTFVVDAYTFRLCSRFSINAGDKYADVKRFFENNLPKSAELYNNFHACIVINAKEHCKKNNPLCTDCPLSAECRKLGFGCASASVY